MYTAQGKGRLFLARIYNPATLSYRVHVCRSCSKIHASLGNTYIYRLTYTPTQTHLCALRSGTRGLMDPSDFRASFKHTSTRVRMPSFRSAHVPRIIRRRRMFIAGKQSSCALKRHRYTCSFCLSSGTAVRFNTL